MNKILTILTGAMAALATGLIFADTLELADGTLLEGDFVGSSNGIIVFNAGGDIEAFPESEVVGIFLSAGVSSATDLNATSVRQITVPTGTRLVIRTSDSIDSKRHSAVTAFGGNSKGHSWSMASLSRPGARLFTAKSRRQGRLAAPWVRRSSPSSSRIS